MSPLTPLTPITRALSRLATSAAEPAALPVVLAERPEATVVRVGEAVAKAHAEDADVEALGMRVRLAADPALAGILLPPLAPAAVELLHDGRPATMWPYGTPVDPDGPTDVPFPWEAAGRLLALLHAVDGSALAARLGGGPIPAMRGPARAARAMVRMRETSAHPAARRAVERAWAGLPAWCRAETPQAGPGPGPVRPLLCHGDFHLGQLVRHPAPGGPWLLIDVDDLGLGEPAWDLARPAAGYAAGLLPAEEWQRLLGAYQAGAGAVGEDPWARLDAPARALTAQFAARAIARAAAAGRDLSWDEEALVEACARIARSRTGGNV
jgi:aminoglycoside phosphotransferase (APT) family kinase protein